PSPPARGLYRCRLSCQAVSASAHYPAPEPQVTLGFLRAFSLPSTLQYPAPSLQPWPDRPQTTRRTIHACAPLFFLRPLLRRALPALLSYPSPCQGPGGPPLPA